MYVSVCVCVFRVCITNHFHFCCRLILFFYFHLNERYTIVKQLSESYLTSTFHDSKIMSKDYTRKKPIISGTVSPLHKKRVEQLVEAGEFASVSDFIGQAVSDLLNKYEDRFSGNTIAPIGNPNSFTEDEMILLRSILREKAAEMNFEKPKKK